MDDELSKYEGDYLQGLRNEARLLGVPVMVKETALVLCREIERLKPENILEIGAAVGYSSSLMLRTAGKNSRITTMEIDEESFNMAKRTHEELGYSDRVTMYLGDATEIVPNMSGRFDFIFLDGPKSHYYEFLPFLKRMLDCGGTLVADNVLFRGLVRGNKKFPQKLNTIVFNMRKFLNAIENDSDFDSQILDTGDGILIATKTRKK